VSHDGRWAAFAGYGHMAAVDTDGRIVWQTRHPHSTALFYWRTFSGSVVFPPVDSQLWAFVPVHSDDDGGVVLERWVVDLAEGMVLSRTPAGHIEPSEVFPPGDTPKGLIGKGSGLVIHPDGQTLGYGWSEEGWYRGFWARWTGSKREGIVECKGFPADVHADQSRWLATSSGSPIVGRFGDSAVVDAGDLDEHDAFDFCVAHGGVCFASDRYVLVWRSRRDQTETEHALLDVRTLGLAGRVRYPGKDGADQIAAVVGGHDGTWVTFAEGRPLRRWRLRNNDSDPDPQIQTLNG
jgi:hypothetical protein